MNTHLLRTRPLPWWTTAWFAVALLLSVAWPSFAWDPPKDGLQPVPALTTRVTDPSGLLTPSERSVLESRLTAWESKTSGQIAVLLVRTTQPEPIEDYSLRVAEAWKLGRRGVDNGVLFLVARDDKKMRIEVGRGLEGAVPDVIAKRILNETVSPFFRKNDFAGGLNAGVDALEKAILKGEAPGAATVTPGKSGAPPGGQGGGNILDSLLPFVVIAFMVVPFVGYLLRSILGRFAGSLVGGGGAGAIAFLVTGSVIAAVIAGVITLLIVALTGFGGQGRAARGGRSSGGWTTGGWSSGGGGGSSGGGGSWSGGGGDFGGGGASGSWGDNS